MPEMRKQQGIAYLSMDQYEKDIVVFFRAAQI